MAFCGDALLMVCDKDFSRFVPLKNNSFCFENE